MLSDEYIEEQTTSLCMEIRKQNGKSLIGRYDGIRRCYDYRWNFATFALINLHGDDNRVRF